MKVAIKNKLTEKWKTYRKVKNVSTTDSFVILTFIDGTVKVKNRDEVKHIRQTKLYEKE